MTNAAYDTFTRNWNGPDQMEMMAYSWFLNQLHCSQLVDADGLDISWCLDQILQQMMNQQYAKLTSYRHHSTERQLNLQAWTFTLLEPLTLYAPSYWATSSPIRNTLSSLAISSSIAMFSASLIVTYTKTCYSLTSYITAPKTVTLVTRLEYIIIHE